MILYQDRIYCVNGCGRPATTERLITIIPTGEQDFIEVVELVCVECDRVSGMMGWSRSLR